MCRNFARIAQFRVASLSSNIQMLDIVLLTEDSPTVKLFLQQEEFLQEVTFSSNFFYLSY